MAGTGTDEGPICDARVTEKPVERRSLMGTFRHGDNS